MPTFYYSDIIIIYGNNSKSIPRLRSVKFLLILSTSARTFAPSSPILFSPKIIMKKWKNNRLIIAIIINENIKFVWTIKIIIQINIKT